VRVRGFNVPTGPQPFVLASTGAFAAWPPSGATDAPRIDRPGATRLQLAVSPNPTRAGAAITLGIPGSGPRETVVEIYDLHGARVAVPWDGPAVSGATVITWDGRDTAGRDVPAGVYFVRASRGDEVATRKILVLH
jgi:hypothetical protein